MPAKSATLKGLQRQCKTEGLDTTGTRADFRGQQEGPAGAFTESQDDTECDAILVTRSEIGSEEELKKDAKDALGQALQEEELHVHDVRGELFVGNLRGLSFANFKDKKIASLEVKNASLEDRVSSLTISLDAYKLLRNRFISTFKRDKLANATEADRRIIGEGNAWAYGGYCCRCHAVSKRRDASTYKRLYGMDPLRVLLISEVYQTTIAVMNICASTVSSKYKVDNEKFYETFAEYIKLLEYSNFDDSYLDDGKMTSLTGVYWTFLQCAKDVETVEEDRWSLEF
ncbi:hypothetical protein BDD12DRAFT_800063 [Trichophaea hybrida]|nr:hypothetical protein BDD12DRAFT_800063 [Trichophaea hybrida]